MDDRLLDDLRDAGGLMSRGALIDIGYMEADLQSAEQRGKIVIAGDGVFASIFLVED